MPKLRLVRSGGAYRTSAGPQRRASPTALTELLRDLVRTGGAVTVGMRRELWHPLRAMSRGALHAVVLLSLGVGAVPSSAGGGWCRERADLVGACFAVRGRAALYNGNPTVRIWKVGTRRMLGVSDARCMPPGCAPLPAELRASLDWEHALLGDFVLCPFTTERPGVMQLVCIDAATRLRRVAVPSH